MLGNKLRPRAKNQLHFKLGTGTILSHFFSYIINSSGSVLYVGAVDRIRRSDKLYRDALH
jgi:hypothetical protein